MQQVAAIRDVSQPRFVDKNIVIFNWAKTCQGARERVYAAMITAQAAEGGRFKTGDVVTVGYNAHSDQVILAAPGRSRIVAKVALEADDAEAVVRRLGWEIHRVDVPDAAQGRFQKSPLDWELECGKVQEALR